MSILDTHKKLIDKIFIKEFNMSVDFSKIFLNDVISSIFYYSVETDNVMHKFKIITTSNEHTVIYKNKDLMYVFNRDDYD